MTFLWLLLETEVLKEEQADSTLTGYRKICDTKSHISFHFYATLLLEKCSGKKTHGVRFPLVHMEIRSSRKFRRLQGKQF